MNLRNLCGSTVAFLTNMRAFPIVLIAALLLPVGASGQQRVPPEADRGSSAPAPAAPREASPPPQPAPAPAPPPPSTSSAPASERAVPRGAATATAGDSNSAPNQRRTRVPPEASRDQPGATPRTGTAVPRPPGQPPRVGGDHDGHDRGHVIVPGWAYNHY